MVGQRYVLTTAPGVASQEVEVRSDAADLVGQNAAMQFESVASTG
jgi:hypothetical protein